MSAKSSSNSTSDTSANSNTPTPPPTSALSEAPKAAVRPYTGEDDIHSLLKEAAKTLERVFQRQAKDDTLAVVVPEPVKEVNPSNPSDPIIDVLERLVGSFKSGSSTAQVREEVTVLASSQAERMELVNSLLLAHDADRLPGYLKLRSLMEGYLLKCATRGDLNPVEALAFLKIAQVEIESITTRVRSTSASNKDVNTLLEKADFVNVMSEEELNKKFAGTSAAGRELIRKIGYRLTKAAKQK